MTSGFYLGTCFLGGGEDGKGEVRPRGLPPRKMLACLYPHTSIHQCLLTGKSFLNAIYYNWEIFRGGEA